MTKREKILMPIAAAMLLFWLGLPTLRAMFVAPVEDRQQRLDVLSGELTIRTKEVVRIKEAARALKRWRGRSLPGNPVDSQRLYQAWLTDLGEMTHIEDLKVMPGRRTPKASTYTGVLVKLEGRAKIAQLGRFLHYFFRADLLHRIVSMNVESKQNEGDPMLGIALTAEGLTLARPKNSECLYPQTNLTTEFHSSNGEQMIEIADGVDFPSAPPFRIRIGREYLNVVEVSQTGWKTRGGHDATAPERHQRGDLVEFAPVHPRYAATSWDDYRQLADRSPFVKPSPEAVVVSVPTVPDPAPTPQRTAPPDRSAAETFLVASITEDDKPQAWLYRPTSGPTQGQRTVVHKDSEVHVGEVQAVVLDIRSDHVIFERDDARWKLRMGENLESMRKMAPSAQ